MKPLILAGVCLCLANCATMDRALSGKTIARLDVTHTERASATIQVGRTGELRMWAEIDALYQGEPIIEFEVEVHHKGVLVHSCNDDALWHYDGGGSRSYLFVRNSHRNGRQRTRYQKRLLDCNFTPPEAGLYRIEVRRRMALGKFFELNRCNLLIKSN